MTHKKRGQRGLIKVSAMLDKKYKGQSGWAEWKLMWEVANATWLEYGTLRWSKIVSIFLNIGRLWKNVRFVWNLTVNGRRSWLCQLDQASRPFRLALAVMCMRGTLPLSTLNVFRGPQREEREQRGQVSDKELNRDAKTRSISPEAVRKRGQRPWLKFSWDGETSR